jgi:hypothetical protein
VPQTAAEAEATEQSARPLLRDYLDPADPVHVKNLYNDYVYFWRWAIWKLFEQAEDGHGDILSFITASSYLAGPGFVGMREVMRRKFDELWIINLGGDNHGARKSECLRHSGARRHRYWRPPRRAGSRHASGGALCKNRGHAGREACRTRRDQDLAEIRWLECPSDWHAPFLPIGKGDYFDFPALVDLFPWVENGVQFKRTWPIAENPDILQRYLNALAAGVRERAAASERRCRHAAAEGPVRWGRLLCHSTGAHARHSRARSDRSLGAKGIRAGRSS